MGSKYVDTCETTYLKDGRLSARIDEIESSSIIFLSGFIFHAFLMGFSKFERIKQPPCQTLATSASSVPQSYLLDAAAIMLKPSEYAAISEDNNADFKRFLSMFKLVFLLPSFNDASFLSSLMPDINLTRGAMAML